MGHITEIFWLFCCLGKPSPKHRSKASTPQCPQQKQNKNRTCLCGGDIEPCTTGVSKKAHRPVVVSDEEVAAPRQGGPGGGEKPLSLPRVTSAASSPRMLTQLGWQVAWQRGPCWVGRQALLGLGDQRPRGLLLPSHPASPSWLDAAGLGQRRAGRTWGYWPRPLLPWPEPAAPSQRGPGARHGGCPALHLRGCVPS